MDEAPAVILGRSIAAAMLVLLVVTPAWAQPTPPAGKTQPARQPPPRFEDFRVSTPIPARKKPAEIADKQADVIQQLIDATKAGPDFARHFYIADMSCGSSCTHFAIVNVQSRKIYYGPFTVFYAFCPAWHCCESALEYRLDSRLLVIRGHIKTHHGGDFTDGPCGTFYYMWNGHSLRLIESVIVPPPSSTEK